MLKKHFKSALLTILVCLFVGAFSVSATWPNAPAGNTIGGWLGSIFDLDASGPGELVVKGNIIADDPINPNHLVTKKYLDEIIAEKLSTIPTPPTTSTETHTDSPSCVDADGKSYDVVKIGTQWWMAENLNVGTMINGTTNPTNNSTIQKWCLDNNETNCTNEGAFYNWNEMMAYTNTEGAQGICPSGWHIPTDAEWYTLESGLATGTCDANRNSYSCDPAGTALKSGGSSGFNAVLGGYRAINGSFISQDTFFWSSSESSGIGGWDRHLSSSSIFPSTVARLGNDKAYGFSLRCLQN